MKDSIQKMNTADSVLLSRFTRDNGRCGIPHVNITTLKGCTKLLSCRERQARGMKLASLRENLSLGCTAAEDGQRLEISDLGIRGIVLSM